MHFCFLKWDYQLGVWGWVTYCERVREYKRCKNEPSWHRTSEV